MTTIDIEPQAGPSGTVMIFEFWTMLLRGKRVILTCIALFLAAAWTIVTFTTPIYRSETVIMAEEQKISQSYVQGVAEAEFELRFFGIQKQIFNHKLLGEVFDEFKLYPDIVATRGREAGIAKMARRISVEMIDKIPGAKFTMPRSVAAFTISFVHEDPRLAMKVTSRIAAKFLEENLRGREQKAEDTSEFFDLELQRVQRQLEIKEEEIKRFKARHLGELPQQVEANLRALDRFQSDIKAVNESIQRFTDRLSLVEKAIQEYESFGTTNGALVTRLAEPDPLFRRLKELREKLIKLKAEFWESYPEVLVTKEELRQVEEELVAQYGPNAIKPGEKPRDPYLQDLKRQQSEARSELAVLTQRRELLQKEKKSYEDRIEKAPTVEQELLTLTRDYDNMKRDYQTLLDKRLNATVTENLEKQQKGAQYRVVDPASFPSTPEWPVTWLIMFLGFFMGSAVGVGIVAMKEQLNPQFRCPEDIERAIGPQLLAVIPDFATVCGSTRWKRLLPYYQWLGRGKREIGGGEQPMLEGQLLHGAVQDAQCFESDIVVKYLPRSIVAEQYRVAATRFALSRVKEQSTIVGITSALQGEGKTTTVVNLGYTMARDLGKRTVLMDCDFKRPALTRYANNVYAPGLADCLRNSNSVDECLIPFPTVPCWIMPVGKCEDESNELLKAERLGGIFDQLRDRFEYILINAPPILPLADMNVIIGYVDVLLLVVRAVSTPQDSVRRALSTLMTDKPLYVLLNAARGQYLPYYIQDYSKPAYKRT